jgi:hypothetical protein
MGGRRTGSRFLIGLLAAAVLSLDGAAFGAGSWTLPYRLTPADGGLSAECPLVASNGPGDAIVVWQRASLVQAVTRERGSSAWSTPVDVAEGRCPDIALTESGDAIVVFTKGDVYSTNTVFQAAFRPRGSEWEPPVTLSDGPLSGGGTVAVDPKGNAVAIGARFLGRRYVVQASYRAASTGAWRPATDLSDSAGNSPRGHDVALDRAGNAVAVFARTGPVADRPILQARVRSVSTGEWSPAVDLAGPYLDVGSISVAVDRAGNATAAWIATDAESVRETVMAAYRPAGGSWSLAAPISPAADLTRDLQLAVSETGLAAALWTQTYVGRYGVVKAAVRPAASRAWQAPVDLQTGASGVFPSETSLALDPRGNAVALWTVAETLRAALREAATDAWLPSEELASSNNGLAWPSVALDGAGSAVATWGEQTADAKWFTQASDLPVTAFDAPVLLNTGRPYVRGRARVGGTLTCFPGRWKGTQPIAYSYAWLRNGRPRSAGRAARITRADGGALLSCRVRAANAWGARNAVSPAVRVPRR